MIIVKAVLLALFCGFFASVGLMGALSALGVPGL